MLFNSVSFLIYFPIVVGLYFVLPQRFRVTFLLVASCYFYMAFVPKYILILGALIVIDYFVGRALERVSGRRRKYLLVISIISNLGILFAFKYFNFFNENIATLANWLHWNYSMATLSLILPLGLSFHTFQSLSYIVEVYRGAQKAERNFLTYALYVMFFPQLVAGPIERPQHLLHQFYERHTFEYSRTVEGLKLMLVGFFKKIVVADNIAGVVSHIYGHPAGISGPALILATFLFAIQLYGDFSGYSDIAVGAAKVLGFDLVKNFNYPYFSRSIAEFWRRWHISLSSWLHDYVYFPLARLHRPVTAGWIYFSTIVTFVLIGLWHGAGWTFIIMGALHGIYISFGQATKRLRGRLVEFIGLNVRPRLHVAVQVVITFVLASVGWIFFRAQSLADAWLIIKQWPTGLLGLLTFNPTNWKDILSGQSGLGLSAYQLVVIVFGVILLWIFEYFSKRRDLLKILAEKSIYIRWGVYYAVVLTILFFGYFGEQPFIYFQF